MTGHAKSKRNLFDEELSLTGHAARTQPTGLAMRGSHRSWTACSAVHANRYARVSGTNGDTNGTPFGTEVNRAGYVRIQVYKQNGHKIRDQTSRVILALGRLALRCFTLSW